MATQIGYLAEEYLLLSGNYFNSLKRKSIIDVLVTLQEKIYQAWRDKKFSSLITFDVKKAFNDNSSEVLALGLC